MSNTVGGRIKAARMALALSQKQLAEIALDNANNARQISDWESDARTPSIESLRRIAPHLNVCVAELIPDSTIKQKAV